MSDAEVACWPTHRLEDCMEVILDYRGKTPRKSPFGIPLITAKVVKDGRIREPDEYIPVEDYDAWMRRGLPQRGDVVVTTEAPAGEVGQLDGSKVALAQRIITLRGRQDLLDNTFLKYLMQSPFVQHQLHALGTGTTVTGFRSREFRSLRLPTPPLSEQRAIAHILGVLDDKIELCRRTNHTLERIARALFQSWFVDFDPVVAKSEGRKPVGVTDGVADLFPSRLRESELGALPEAWTYSTVGREFDIRMGQSPPGSTYNESGVGIPFFQGRTDFGTRFPRQRVFCSAPTRIAEPDDTLLTVRAPVGDVNLASTRCAIGRGIAAIRHKTGSRSYTYYSMGSLADELAAFDAEGTVFGAVTRDGIRGIGFVAPPDTVIRAFDRIAAPLDDLIQSNEREMGALAATRDRLLRKLLSGEIRVQEAVSLDPIRLTPIPQVG